MIAALADYLFLNPALCAGLFFCLGTILGSFAGALAYRLPRGLDWVGARSRCPSCGHLLGARDLVPVLSWCFLKGRCRYCRAPVSARYPLVELAFGAMFALVGMGVLTLRLSLS